MLSHRATNYTPFRNTCAPQKVDPALIARVRPTIVGCFWPVFFCGSQPSPPKADIVESLTPRRRIRRAWKHGYTSRCLAQPRRSARKILKSLNF